MKLAMRLILATSLAACAPPLETDGSRESEGIPVGELGGPNVSHEEQGGRSVLSVVDATDEQAWIYLDLPSGEQREPLAPTDDPDWDLAFRRFHIKLNGGASGNAGVEAAVLTDVAFGDVVDAPADGYVTDRTDGDDDNEDPDYVFAAWYDYDFMTHVLTPLRSVYVIRTAAGSYYKIQIEDYYDDAGTSAYVAFRWATIDGEG